MTSLNTQPISQDVLAEKYLAAGEQTAEDLFRRVPKLWPIKKNQSCAPSGQRSFSRICKQAPSAQAASWQQRV